MDRTNWMTRVIDWALDVDDADPKTVLGLVRLWVSGLIVLCVGVGIVARGYWHAFLDGIGT